MVLVCLKICIASTTITQRYTFVSYSMLRMFSCILVATKLRRFTCNQYLPISSSFDMKDLAERWNCDSVSGSSSGVNNNRGSSNGKDDCGSCSSGCVSKDGSSGRGDIADGGSSSCGDNGVGSTRCGGNGGGTNPMIAVAVAAASATAGGEREKHVGAAAATTAACDNGGPTRAETRASMFLGLKYASVLEMILKDNFRCFHPSHTPRSDKCGVDTAFNVT